ncbi:MAG: hypothetical protein PHR30_03475 [Gallionellaceae bacterium]|nr:hypothetical protein [Gallionellaceae bacterium]
MSRSRSSAPGPLGMLMSMIMAAAPPLDEAEGADRDLLEWRKNNEAEKKQAGESLERDTQTHIDKCIKNLKLLPAGAWRSMPERNLILNRLEVLNKARMIHWVDDKEHEDERGGHARGEITMKIDFHWGNWEEDAWMKSAPVLVHEGTHAAWSNSHFNAWRNKWVLDHAGSCKDHPKGEALIAEETYAWENELKVYEVLKNQGVNDSILESRLQRKAAGGVEAMVRKAYEAWINLDRIK